MGVGLRRTLSLPKSAPTCQGRAPSRVLSSMITQPLHALFMLVSPFAIVGGFWLYAWLRHYRR